MSEATPKLPLVVPEDYVSAWKEGMSDEDYHGDKTALSSSSIRYVRRSPKFFYSRFVLGEGRKTTAAMRLGSAVHMAMLEYERFLKNFIEMPNFGDMRSSKNREARDDWMAAQPKEAIILDAEERGKLVRMVESVLSHKVATEILRDGIREQVGYFRDPGTGLQCRIKPDFLRHDLSVLPDLKTCRDASKKGFRKAIWEHRYDMQLEFYRLGIKMIQGRAPEILAFVAVENEAPFDCAVYTADPAMMEKAELDVRRGLERISECLATGNWPGYQEGMAENMALPNWAFYEEEEA